MAEMNARMRLTLEDLASQPLKGFADQIKALEPLANALNDSLQVFGRRIGSVGSAAERSAGGTGKLLAAMTTLGDTLRGFETKLAAVADGFAQFGLNAREAAASARDAASAVGTAGARMDRTAASTRALTGHVYGLNDALKGMAQLWAGMKIEEGMRGAVRAASTMATTQAQMRAMGYGTDSVKYATERSWRDSSNFRAASANDVMQARLALMTATGSNNERLINEALPQMLRNAMAYKVNFAPGSSLADIIGNMGGLAELRGMSQSAAGLIAASNQALQVAEATGGRMKISAQEVVGRQSKYGAAQLLNEQGYKQLMALAEQLTLAGHEGGSGGGRGVSQMGTALSMLTKVMNGGKMAKQTFEMLHAMDMWTAGTTTLGTSTTQTATTGSLRGALEGQTNPLEWVHDVLVPRMLAYAVKNAKQYFPGGNTSDPKAQLEALNRVAIQTWGPTGGVNVANMLSQVANPQIWARISESTARSNRAPTGQKAVDDLNKYTLAAQKFHAAVNNLGNAIGTTLLPVLTPVINAFAAFARGLGQAAHAVPGLTQALSLLASGLGVVLTITGFQALFGKFSELVGWLGRSGAAATAAAAESTAANTAMSATWSSSLRGILGMIGRFAAVATAAFALYEAGENVKIFGVSINNYIRISLVDLVGQFDRFFNWLNTASDRAAAHFFGAISGAAKAVGAHGIAEWAKGHQLQLTSAAASFQRNYDQRSSIRDDMVKYFNSPQAQAGYQRPAHGGPDTEKQIADAQNALAKTLESTVGAVPNLGAAGHAHRKSLQDLLSEWSAHDMRHAHSEAAHQLRQDNAGVSAARRAVSDATRKDSPQSIQAYWNQQASELASSTNPADRALVGQAQALGVRRANQMRLKQAQHHLSDLQGNLRNQQQTNAALVTAGVLTKDQAQAKTLADQRAAAPALEQATAKVQALALAVGDTGLAGRMQVLRQQIEAYGNGLTQFQQKIANVGQSAFQGLFSAMMRGQESWRQMGHNFVAQILNGMNQSISQDLAQGLMHALTGSNTSTGQALRGVGSSGGVIGSLVQSVFGTKSGGSGGSTATAGGGFWSTVGGWLEGLGASHAAGLDLVPHDMVAKIHQGEMIVPAAAAEALRAGSLGTTHHWHMSPQVIDSQDFLGALGKVAREASQMMSATNQNLNLGL